MKKLINLLILFTTILSLTFIPAIPTNAASKVNITYYAGKGYFKAKPNRSKNKITIKNKINKKRVYPGKFNCKNEKGDLIYISSWYGYDSDSYQIDYLNCKLKNVINIKKPTSMSTFFKKLGVKKYNYNSKTHTIDFICKKCYCNFHNDDAEYEDIWWTIKMNDKNQLTPDTIVNFQLITDWEVW